MEGGGSARPSRALTEGAPLLRPGPPAELDRVRKSNDLVVLAEFGSLRYFGCAARHDLLVHLLERLGCRKQSRDRIKRDAIAQRMERSGRKPRRLAVLY